jgi:hypothetical protein
MPLWLGTAKQKAFWKDVGHWLDEVDEVQFRDESEINIDVNK